MYFQFGLKNAIVGNIASVTSATYVVRILIASFAVILIQFLILHISFLIFWHMQIDNINIAV